MKSSSYFQHKLPSMNFYHRLHCVSVLGRSMSRLSHVIFRNTWNFLNLNLIVVLSYTIPSGKEVLTPELSSPFSHPEGCKTYKTNIISKTLMPKGDIDRDK